MDGDANGVDLDALTAWMDTQQLGEGPLEHLERLSGGTQNILLRFRRAGRDYVLRRPPPVLRAIAMKRCGARRGCWRRWRAAVCRIRR